SAGCRAQARARRQGLPLEVACSCTHGHGYSGGWAAQLVVGPALIGVGAASARSAAGTSPEAVRSGRAGRRPDGRRPRRTVPPPSRCRRSSPRRCRSRARTPSAWCAPRRGRRGDGRRPGSPAVSCPSLRRARSAAGTVPVGSGGIGRSGGAARPVVAGGVGVLGGERGGEVLEL